MAMCGGLASPLAGQVEAGTTAGFELTRSTQHSLHRLQESWLQWVSGFYQDNPTKAGEALRALSANGRQVGMSKLVDFSLGNEGGAVAEDAQDLEAAVLDHQLESAAEQEVADQHARRIAPDQVRGPLAAAHA